MSDTKNTYWSQSGKYQELHDQLSPLVPDVGLVKNPTKNKELERFRKACNAYYDLYNNGGCNRGRSISKLFGVSFSSRDRYHSQYLYDRVEQSMDQIIKNAAIEQNIC